MLTASTMDDHGFNLLCNAIASRAVDDYIKVTHCGWKLTEPCDSKSKKHKPISKHSLEKFFL